MSATTRASLLMGLCLPLAAQLADNPKVSIVPRPAALLASAALPGERSIRVSSNLVLIPVTVTDPRNRFVSGLDKNDFRVLEEDIEQQVSQFGCEDSPMSVGLVFDMSGSMGKKLQKSREAAAEVLKQANPEDEFFLIQFNDRPELLTGFTRDAEEVQNRLLFTHSKGRTALLDAIYLALHTMRKARNPRKALVIISDGGDNSSRYREREIKQIVSESDVQIYAMGIFEPVSSRARTAEEISGPGLLTHICDQTGGRHFAIGNVSELPDVAARIANELHNHYVIGYAPRNPDRDGKYRRVRVKLVQPTGLPPLRAHWRLGYYAPGE